MQHDNDRNQQHGRHDGGRNRQSQQSQQSQRSRQSTDRYLGSDDEAFASRQQGQSYGAQRFGQGDRSFGNEDYGRQAQAGYGRDYGPSHGQAQDFGQPRNYSQSQNYGPAQGHGGSQAYGSPQGYGGFQGYGASPSYAGSQDFSRNDEYSPQGRGSQYSGSQYIGTQGGYPGSGFQGGASGYAQGWGDFGSQHESQATQFQSQQLGQHRGKGPKGYTRSDDRIKEDISERLSDDALVDASDITVESRNGIVVLSGTVDSRQLKHRIEDMVECCSGVKDIENKLTVRSSGPSTAPKNQAGMSGAAASTGTGATSASGKPS